MSSEQMNSDYGSILLPIARASIAEPLGEVRATAEQAPWLQLPGACFVTLTQNDELRGCIGSLEAHRPLLLDVKANAYAAAFRDPRFKPLIAAELGRTEVEISLLSEMQPLEFASEQEALAKLQPGIHGVVFEYGQYRSTFLPQVWDQLPKVTDFMGHLKSKAGLSPSFWAKEVKLSLYSVSKWKESELTANTVTTNVTS